MQQHERDDLAKTLGNWMVSFGIVPNRAQVTSFLDALSFLGLDYENSMTGISRYFNEPRNKTFPTPIQIRHAINESIESKDVAILLAKKIDAAVRKYGYAWSEEIYSGEHNQNYFIGGGQSFWTFKEAVIAELGPTGWAHICENGGWQAVRNSSNEMEEGIFIAQTRDSIKALIELSKNGIDLTRFELPEAKRREALPSNVIPLIQNKQF